MNTLITHTQRQDTLERLERTWRDILKPPSNIDPVTWCEANIVLPPSSPAPGFISFNRTPYLREIIRTITGTCNKITLCFASQVGKTLAETCIGSYVVCERPTPILFAISTKDLADEYVFQKLDPVIEGCEPLKALLHETRSDDTTSRKRFKSCTWTITGGMSKRASKHRSVGLCLLDEIDDMGTGIYSKLRQRINAYPNGKIYQSSTPDLETGPIWTQFTLGSCEYFEVPCPECLEFQRLTWDNVRFEAARTDNGWDTELARQIAFYCCPHCGFHITDVHKANMLLQGVWVAERPQIKSHRSFHLNALYSPFLTFGEVVAEFLNAEHHAESVKDFRTGWLAEPWGIATRAGLAHRIASKCGEYERGQVPVPPVAIVLTADYGEKRIHWVVTAIAEHGASFLIDMGTVATLQDLEESVRHRLYDGFPINLIGVDCGHDTPEVKDFCLQHGYIALFGNTKIHGTYQFNKAERHLLLNVDIVKDYLDDKIDAPLGKWNLFKNDNTLDEFFAHMGAEQRVYELDPNGWQKRKWKKLRKANHYFDCVVYAEGLSLALGLRFAKPLSPVKPKDEKPEPVKKPAPPETPGHFDRLNNRYSGRRNVWAGA